MSMIDRTVRSPDGCSDATLEYLGEIRFGPSYFQLLIGGRRIPERIFGYEPVWSPDSRYLAVQEWRTTDVREGPQTQLVVVDVHRWQECILSKATQGFVEPVGFVGNIVLYRKSYYAQGKIIDYEQDLPPSDQWRPTAG